MAKLVVDSGFKKTGKHSSITCTADELVCDPEDIGRGPAEAIAAAIEAGIASNPARTRDGKRQLFVRTGKLSHGITAQPSGDGFDIVPPPDRLQDPALIDRLCEVVPAAGAPLDQPLVQEAIARANEKLTVVEKR